MKRSEIALDYFSKGFNCAQSVLVSFVDILKLEEEKALRIASGFGGGMGSMQNTCGAVTGAFMVIGYLKGKYKEGNDEAKATTNKIIQEYTAKFIDRHDSINCKTLINFDLSTEEGKRGAEDAGVFKKKCTVFITESVEILEKILKLN